MKIPRIDTIMVKNSYFQNNVGMKIPAGIGKPVADLTFRGNSPDCDTKNERLNFLA